MATLLNDQGSFDEAIYAAGDAFSIFRAEAK